MAKKANLNGWVSLYRSLLNWEWHANPNTMTVFIHLLLLASHKDGEWRGTEIKRGQVITSRASLAKITGLTEQQTRTSLNNLQNTNEITIQSTSQYSLVTLVNYDKYQRYEQSITSETTSDATNETPAFQPAFQPANQPHRNKSNNINKFNNSNKESTAPAKARKIEYADGVTMTADEWQKLVDGHGEEKARRFVDKLSVYKMTNNKRYASDYHAILKWVVKAIEEEDLKKPKKYEASYDLAEFEHDALYKPITYRKGGQ